MIQRIIQTELLLYSEYSSIVKKLKQLTMQNYLYLKFPFANLRTLSGVLLAKILLENLLILTFSAFAIFF